MFKEPVKEYNIKQSDLLVICGDRQGTKVIITYPKKSYVVSHPNYSFFNVLYRWKRFWPSMTKVERQLVYDY